MSYFLPPLGFPGLADRHPLSAHLLALTAFAAPSDTLTVFCFPCSQAEAGLLGSRSPWMSRAVLPKLSHSLPASCSRKFLYFCWVSVFPSHFLPGLSKPPSSQHSTWVHSWPSRLLCPDSSLPHFWARQQQPGLHLLLPAPRSARASALPSSLLTGCPLAFSSPDLISVSPSISS